MADFNFDYEDNDEPPPPSSKKPKLNNGGNDFSSSSSSAAVLLPTTWTCSKTLDIGSSMPIVRFTNNGKYVVASDRNGGSVSKFEIETGKCRVREVYNTYIDGEFLFDTDVFSNGNSMISQYRAHSDTAALQSTIRYHLHIYSLDRQNEAPTLYTIDTGFGNQLNVVGIKCLQNDDVLVITKHRHRGGGTNVVMCIYRGAADESESLDSSDDSEDDGDVLSDSEVAEILKSLTPAEKAVHIDRWPI